MPARIAESIENYRFREALAFMMDVARAGNKYLADTEPWKLIKTDPERVKTILNLALQVVANLSVLAEPFLPFTSLKLQELLQIHALKWSDAGSADLLNKDHVIRETGLLFEKIEDITVEGQVKKLQETKALNEAENANIEEFKDHIAFDDFQKMDIRVSTILEAEKVAKTKKLLKLKLDTGLDIRTVVSGIAEYYEPEKIIGQQVCLLANLAPREIKGILSQGMILMAEDKDGRLSFVSPGEKTSNGSRVS
jgi:methionyl-tRNA synthetase